MTVTPASGKGTLDLGGSIVNVAFGHSAELSLTYERGLGPRANRGSRGVCESALKPLQAGKAQGRKAKVPNRTWESRLSGITGGPCET